MNISNGNQGTPITPKLFSFISTLVFPITSLPPFINVSSTALQPMPMETNWRPLPDLEDEDNFFESRDRISISSVIPLDLPSSDTEEEEDDFAETRTSFSDFRQSVELGTPAEAYRLWIAQPGSIRERRRRLLQGLGISVEKELLRLATPKADRLPPPQPDLPVPPEPQPEPDPDPDPSPLLVRSRSEGEIGSTSLETTRRKDLIGEASKQRLTRTSSPPCARLCPSISVSPSPLWTPSRSPMAFFLIKNLDTGKEFVVNEYDQHGMWNRLSDLQTGKQLTMEEFELCVGHSPVVKELMRREHVSSDEDNAKKITADSYLSKSFRYSKRRGVALLKNIKGVANSVSGFIPEKEREKEGNHTPWVKVRQHGKSQKEVTALYLCQEIRAHDGPIWSIRFSPDTHLLASAGEDRIIHIWEVQEVDCGLSLQSVPRRKNGSIPDYVHLPESMFSLSESPICSFTGHLDDVLDLSWSKSELLLSSSMDKTVRLWDMETKSCLRLFAHNDYVTCIQFNPTDDNYFISGSLDAKVRLWSVRQNQVVDWTDLHEMVTAACFTPDGQGAMIGLHKGKCRMYNIEDYKMNQAYQFDILSNKKSHGKKITGFQFTPGNPSEVLITSADSRIRIYDGSEMVHKFRGFRNTSSQISASFASDGKHVICASEDSQVFVWRREDLKNASSGKHKGFTDTRFYEHFQCRDVTVAVPWHGSIKEEPPLVVQSKRHSKRISPQPLPAIGSPSRDDNCTNTQSKRQLPPLPKKQSQVEKCSASPEHELCRSLRVDSRSENNDSFASSPHGDSLSSSYRYGELASLSASDDLASSSSVLDGHGHHGDHTIRASAWGMVIVTATVGGELRAYQNFGLPVRIGRQTSLIRDLP